MSNTLTDLMDTLVMPMAQDVLRENSIMAALVNTDYRNEAATQNQTIRIPRPQSMGTAGTFDSAVGSSSTDLDDPYVDITMANWRYAQFEMSDAEMWNAVTAGIVPSAVDAAVKSLANAVDLSLLELYKEIYNYYGDPASTPDASSDIIGVRKILQNNLAPVGNRRLVLDTEAEAKFLDLYEKVNESGSTQALREASLGKLFGLETFTDQLIPTHTKGTLAAGTAIAAAGVNAIGSTTIILDDSGGASLTGTLLKGDRITFATSTTIHTVTALATAAANAITITISPALDEATADGTVVTVKDAWTPNLAFHRDAMVLAMRPLQDTMNLANTNSTISVQIDPISGIPLRLETWRDPKYSTQYWKFDVLYGVKLVRPELAAILFG